MQEADPCCSSLLSSTELCLIFLCSRDTSVPHMLGFKRLYPQVRDPFYLVTLCDLVKPPYFMLLSSKQTRGVEDILLFYDEKFK